MTESPDTLLVTEIELTIRAVPGVTTLFRSGSTASKLLHAGADLVRADRGTDPLVRLERTPEGARIEAALGIRVAANGVETLERVRLAVEEVLAAHGLSAAQIHLTVVHVNGAPESAH